MNIDWPRTLIDEIMTDKLLIVPDDERVRTAARIMEEYQVGSLLVCKEGKTIGILTEADIVRSLISTGLSLDETRVQTIMSGRRPITIRPYSTIEEAYLSMARNRIRHLIVVAEKVEEGEVEVGIVSVRDILYPKEEVGEEVAAQWQQEIKSWIKGFPWTRRDRIEKIMTRKLVMVEGDENILKASTLMGSKQISTLLIKEEDKVKGVLSETDIVRRVIAKSLDPEKTKTSEVMTGFPVTISSKDPIDQAYSLMANKRIRHLVVTSRDRVVGIISARDLVCLPAMKIKRAWKK
ncbi:MAG: CBS domain-containing protein [bacterium]